MGGRLKALLTLKGLSRGWQAAACAGVGAILGLGLVVARIFDAPSYLSSSPKTCLNCHVMSDAYASWERGSHARAAGCVDCHLPHSNPVATVAHKARDGAWDTFVFLARLEPQVMRLSAGGGRVVQANCVRCHADQLQMVRLAGPEERVCWDCHRDLHGRVHSLSASHRVLTHSVPRATEKVPGTLALGPPPP